jgi:thiamine-monophosphate kinase
MAVNLSDIGAMGGVPRWALVTLALPPDTDAADVDALYAGLRGAAAPHGVEIVGGDTSASRAGWMITVTLLGEHAAAPRLRSGARAGDAVVVTGALGRSAAGLAALEAGAERARAAGVDAAALAEVTAAHRRPQPRIAEGRWLGAQSTVHALIDCSDGIATDLGHVCRESAVAARVWLDRLPIAPAARATAAALGADALAWATGGGEDYELLGTCAPEAAEALAQGLRRATGTDLTVIGEVTGGAPAVTWLGPRGEPVGVPAGYEHFHG